MRLEIKYKLEKEGYIKFKTKKKHIHIMATIKDIRFFVDNYLMHEKDYIDNNVAVFSIRYTKHHNTENPSREHKDAELLEQLLQQKGINFVRGWIQGSDPSRGMYSYSIFKTKLDEIKKLCQL